MTLQYRDAIGGEVRSFDDGARQIVARVCNYNAAPDTYRTTWSAGVFADSLAAQKPVVCWGHDHRNVIGSVVDYRDDADGLDVTIQLADFDAVPQARAAYSLIKDGHIRGWSFGFADGQTIPDPHHRGALKFTKAALFEVSPVVRPSVPGTRTVSVRSDDGETREVSTETLAGTLATQFAEALANGERSVGVTLGDDGEVDMTRPQQIEAPEATVQITPDRQFTAALVSGVREALTEGLRDLTIRVGQDGTVTTGTDSPMGDSGAEPADDGYDRNTVISAIDGAIDAALSYAEQLDLSSLPDEVGMVVQLLNAADVACDELMENEGIPDYDDPGASGRAADDDGERAAMTAKAIDDLPDSDFAYIEPGGTKDAEGKTVPRSLRHFPIQDKAHVQNALSRAPQSEFGDKAMPKIKEAAKKFGVDVADDGKREADDIEVRAALALSRLNHR